MICYVLLTSMQMGFKNNLLHNAFDSMSKQQKKKKYSQTKALYIYFFFILILVKCRHAGKITLYLSISRSYEGIKRSSQIPECEAGAAKML